jgi:type VI protein secretion system component VasK
MSRAEIVQYDKAAASYNKIEKFFNEQLSHKFPFGNSEDDAALADIEEFVEIYDQNSSNLLNILEKNKDRKQIDKKVFDFLNSINKIMSLLKGWIAHSKNSDPKDAIVSFAISMRPSPGSEALTSSVLERVIKVKEVDIPDNSSAVFYNGDAVDVVFGWVKQSDEKPYAKDLPKDLTIDGSDATFSYGGKWAMFRLIENRKTNKEVEYPNGVLLQFDVPIIDSSKGNALMTSKMILKITPMMKAADKLAPIAWPTFPDSCPDLHGNKSIVDQNIPKDIPEINTIKAGGN